MGTSRKPQGPVNFMIFTESQPSKVDEAMIDIAERVDQILELLR